MTRRERGLRQLLTVVAERANARLVEIRKANGGHVQDSFDRGGPLFANSTPSDYRSIKNFTAQARRALR